MAKKKAVPEFVGCALKELPAEHWVEAAEIAVGENPANRPSEAAIQRAIRSGEVDVPQFIAAEASKYWGSKGVKLGVWMDTGNSGLKAKILAYMNKWRTGNPKGANVTFSESSFGMSQVRIAFDMTGLWSYLGTDILASWLAGKPTMNLQGFSLATPESEYERVVTHETGHTLGYPHEHMRKAIIDLLDPPRVIALFGRTQGWSPDEVRAQILTERPESALIAGPVEESSIMAYAFPGSVTRSGRPIAGGTVITAADYAFTSGLYPPPAPVTPPPPVEGGKWSFSAKFEVDEQTNTPKFVGFVT